MSLLGGLVLAPLGDRRPTVLTYNFYNGTVIGMTNGDTLVPDGWIEYPLAGKRQLFKDGEPESEELVVEPAS